MTSRCSPKIPFVAVPLAPLLLEGVCGRDKCLMMTVRLKMDISQHLLYLHTHHFLAAVELEGGLFEGQILWIQTLRMNTERMCALKLRPHLPKGNAQDYKWQN